MNPNSSRLLGDSSSPRVVICCCKLSSTNTWASLVMQPRCKHLKSLIVSKQAFNSQGVAGELRVTSLEKLPSPRGRASRGGSGWYHPAPQNARILGLLPPLFIGLPLAFLSFLVLPLLFPSLLPPISNSLLLCAKTVSGHSEVP